MAEPVFTNWADEYSALWGRHLLQLSHRLDDLSLFSRPVLAGLIERYPAVSYDIVHMDRQGDAGRRWRRGERGSLTGDQVIEAVANGRMWINLRDVMAVDSRYRDLVEAIFDEIEERIPGQRIFNRTMGILISSPGAEVYYHSDLPGQSLWQIAGRKRVYLYPNQTPFLTDQALEDIVTGRTEEDLPYEAWFDDYAVAVDLEPGRMLHWPLYAPHRVVNHDCLNISLTTEYWTEDIRRSFMVNYGNGILRRTFGLAPKSRAIAGPGFWAKAILQKAWRGAGLNAGRQHKRTIDFRLDPDAPGRIVDIAADPI